MEGDALSLSCLGYLSIANEMTMTPKDWKALANAVYECRNDLLENFRMDLMGQLKRLARETSVVNTPTVTFEELTTPKSFCCGVPLTDKGGTTYWRCTGCGAFVHVSLVDNKSPKPEAEGFEAGPESDWHDNAAYDFAQVQHDVALAHLNGIKEKLANYQILEPREETDTVQVGNTVLVRFASMDEDEKFTILGPDDSATRKDWISFATPVAKALIGGKEGEEVTLETNNAKIKILKILKGEFENGKTI